MKPKVVNLPSVENGANQFNCLRATWGQGSSSTLLEGVMKALDLSRIVIIIAHGHIISVQKPSSHSISTINLALQRCLQEFVSVIQFTPGQKCIGGGKGSSHNIGILTHLGFYVISFSGNKEISGLHYNKSHVH